MSVFDQLMAIVFKNEGGFVSHDDAEAIGDPGGETNYGITEVTLAALGIDKRPQDLTPEECVEIYFEHYYKPVAQTYEISDPGLALAIFDAGVQHGVSRSVRFLQGAAGTKVDSKFGPGTRAAVALVPPTLLLLRFHQRRRALLTRWVQALPSKRMTLLAGIIDRTDRVLEAAYLLNVRH